MTHRRTTFRLAVVAAITADVDAAGADVRDEWAARIAGRPVVVVTARNETLVAGAGSMGEPHDRRRLELVFDIYAEGKTGAIAVDQVNDLDEVIGVALGTANEPAGSLHALCEDLRWDSTAIEVGQEQERYIALASIGWSVLYDLYYGDPT